MTIERIPKINVSSMVFEKMKEQILNGTWAPGGKIPSENELTKLFGVSRMTVHSAIQKLSILGLVHSKQGGGTFVSDVTAEIYLNSLLPDLILGKHDLLEIQEFRRVFEIENARLAALKRNDKDLDRLNAILDRMHSYANDIKRFAIEDLNFHLELSRATKNALILKVSQITKDILRSYMYEIIAFQGTSSAVNNHKYVLDAITAKDSKLAAKLMAEHIDNTIQDILEKYPEE
jgi:GntR family transcriptional repressor for pyruvate dehydrogenase complex